MFFEKFIPKQGELPTFLPFHLKDINPLSGAKKERIVYAPNAQMKILHARIVSYLRRLQHNNPLLLRHATGARPGNSPVKNVLIHRRNRYFYLTDIVDAYKSTSGEALVEIICVLAPQLTDEKEETLGFLKQYCLSPDGGLIIGAPASPDLFNVYAGVLLDQPLSEICQKYNLVYSRYFDDLCFSSLKFRIGKRKRQAIRTAVVATGFRVNHRKSKVWDLKKGPVVITGIGLELGGRLFVPSHYRRKVKGLLHNAMKGNVPRPVIDGHMGVLKSIPRSYSTRAGEKILDIYEEYRATQSK